jgi:hypothetical protein
MGQLNTLVSRFDRLGLTFEIILFMSRVFVYLIGIIALALVHLAQAKTSKEVPSYSEVIQSAMTKGSTEELSKFFQPELHLRIGDLEGVFNQKQAEYLIADFFSQYPPKEFLVIHNGETSDSIRYLMGNFYAGGKSFLVLVKGKRDEIGVVRISELEVISP